MKDLEEADFILNIKLVRERNSGVTLSRSHYVEKVLKCFGYSDCKFVQHLTMPVWSEEEQKDNERSAEILSNLWFMMYLASAMRPSISFAVSKLSWFVSNPEDDHWKALERVMHYLKGTMDYKIHYIGWVIEGYSH